MKSRLIDGSDGSASQFPSPVVPVLLQQLLVVCVNKVVSQFGKKLILIEQVFKERGGSMQ